MKTTFSLDMADDAQMNGGTMWTNMTCCNPAGARRCLMVAVSLIIAAIGPWLGATPAKAERRENPIAVFAALDKVTARISRLEIEIGETKTFGALRITPRVCYSRAPTEPPKTTSFIEVDEVNLDKSEDRIFAGWMFAESPGINGVEHSVYDIWLTGCATEFRPVAESRPRKVVEEYRKTGVMPLPVRKPSPAVFVEDDEGGASGVGRRRSLR